MAMTLADPLDPSAYRDRSGPARPRARWELWRSPDDQPAWARPVLLGIAAAGALLFAWNITQAGLAPFYSVAVKSMSVSWKAFIFGAFDPKARRGGLYFEKADRTSQWVQSQVIVEALARQGSLRLAMAGGGTLVLNVHRQPRARAGRVPSRCQVARELAPLLSSRVRGC